MPTPDPSDAYVRAVADYLRRNPAARADRRGTAVAHEHRCSSRRGGRCDCREAARAKEKERR